MPLAVLPLAPRSPSPIVAVLGYSRAENRPSCRVLGAGVDLAGPQGLMPELCPSAVPGLPQDLLQKGSVREEGGSGGEQGSGQHQDLYP